jgi:hypothetical protein
MQMKYIEAQYTTNVVYDLDKLGIDFSKVSKWEAEKNYLYIKYKDGTDKHYRGAYPHIDFDKDIKSLTCYSEQHYPILKKEFNNG